MLDWLRDFNTLMRMWRTFRYAWLLGPFSSLSLVPSQMSVFFMFVLLEVSEKKKNGNNNKISK